MWSLSSEWYSSQSTPLTLETPRQPAISTVEIRAGSNPPLLFHQSSKTSPSLYKVEPGPSLGPAWALMPWLHYQVCAGEWLVVSDNAVISLNNALRHLDFTRQRVRLNQSLSFTLPAQHSRQDTCSCIGKSPPSTRSPGIWTIFLLTSACTRSCLDRLITARTSGR